MWRVDAGWAARLRRASPYLATLIVIAALVLYAVVRGHGGAGERTGDIVAPPTGSPTGQQSAGARSAAPPAAGPTATTAKPHGSKIIDWIRDLGLTGGGTSEKEGLFTALSEGRCAEVLTRLTGAPSDELDDTTVVLYRGAAQACLAAFGQRSALWAPAETALADLTYRGGSLDCIDRSVYDLLRTLIEVHRSDPAATLVRGGQSSTAGPRCPRVRSLDPDHGPAAGGYDILVIGEYFPDPAVIHFGRHTLTVPTSAGQRALVTVPPAGSDDYPGIAVWIEGWPYEGTQSVPFYYDPAVVSPVPSVGGS